MLEENLIIIGVLFLASIFFSKISDKYGIPALIVFLCVGMLAGSDGILGLPFDDTKFAALVGNLALIFILFAGGFDTNIKSVAPILKVSIVLATLGVVITAIVLGLFIYLLLGWSLLESFLLGAIISSTDAAAVFAILRSRGIKLKNNLGELLEFESGSNDPMAIFLTMTIIGIISASQTPTAGNIAIELAMQFFIGGVVGYACGCSLPSILNKIQLSSWGFYPILVLGFVCLVFGITTKIGGNGYIAVYVMGIFANRREYVYKKNLVGFFDGVAWIMQIFVFLTLGLLVFPSSLPSVTLMAALIALFLTFVARPISVFIGTIFTKFSIKEKTFISWVGLRGVVPVILSTYPLSANINHAEDMFNIVFVIVFISVLIQGSTISKAATILGVRLEENKKEEVKEPSIKNQIFYQSIRQFSIEEDSKIIGKNLAELELPENFYVVLSVRDGKYIKVTGSYLFKANDLLLIVCKDEDFYTKILKDYGFIA
nr:potassium/proton antiporter [Campylobacter sputorum]